MLYDILHNGYDIPYMILLSIYYVIDGHIQSSLK